MAVIMGHTHGWHRYVTIFVQWGGVTEMLHYAWTRCNYGGTREIIRWHPTKGAGERFPDGGLLLSVGASCLAILIS